MAAQERAGGKLLRLPSSVEELQFSKYDQALARTLGQIRQPDNRVLSILAAVLSPGAIQRLFGGDDTTGEEAAAYLQEALGIRPVGSDSPLSGAPFDKLAGAAHGDLANTDTWTRARNRALTATQKQIQKKRIGQDDLAALQTTSQAQIEEAQPPNVMILQMGLELSRALSDHEPMLLGLWVDRNRAKGTATAPTTGGGTTGGGTTGGGTTGGGTTGSTTGASTTGGGGNGPVPPDVLAAVQLAELNLSNALEQQEGPAHPLSDLVHHVAAGWIANSSRGLVALDQGRNLTARIAAIYDVATRYLDGTLRGDVFADRPGGIVNIGNTCYLNATVQVLAAHAHYRGLIANAVVVNANPQVQHNGRALQKALDMVIRVINNGTPVIGDLARVLKAALIRCNWHQGNHEEDPSELFALIFDALGLPATMRHQQTTTRTDLTGAVTVAVGNDLENLLPLEITAAGSFGSSFAAFQEEDLEQEQLGVNDAAIHVSRRIFIHRPSVAALLLKRFRQRLDGTFEKITTAMTGMGAMTLGNAQHPATGIVQHLGGVSVTSGHYHARVTRNGHVYRCNDAVVDETTTENATNQEMETTGYLYFYDRP